LASNHHLAPQGAFIKSPPALFTKKRDFKGNINYAEKMGGFATEARELEIVANRIVQKDAEIKYYNLQECVKHGKNI